jgi:tetratricopeptide (TPR) repeat protein
MRRTATVLLLVMLLPASAGAGPAARIVQEALSQSTQGDHLGALELYKKAAGAFEAASVGEREAIRKGLLHEASLLFEKHEYQAAIGGLVALLPLTRCRGSCQSFVIQVRMLLEHAAMTMILTDRSEAAIPALEALLQDSPGTPMRWALLARAYLETGEIESAERTLRRGLSLHADSPELLFIKASLAGTLARLEVSRASYQRAEFLMQDAVRDLQAALLREPREGGIHRALGTLQASLWVYYRATGQYQKALSTLEAAEVAYTDAAHLSSTNPEPAFELGNLLFTAQDWIWAEVWLREARERYQEASRQKGVPEVARASARKSVERCEETIAAALFNRAIDAVNTARFDLARRLLRAASMKLPASAPQSTELLGWVLASRRAFQQKVDRLGGMTESGDAQVELGDLWMRAHRYDLARMAYQRALQGRLEKFQPDQIQDRIHGTLELQEKPVTKSAQVGSLEVFLEAPPELDADFLQNLLQKAHAMTMSRFPHRLSASLGIKVFGNRRAFLEEAAPRVGIYQSGFYAYGRVVTFHQPNRSHRKWLEILEHEITHRYVDEMTYSRAPRWLSEGLALWVSQKWSTAKRLQIDRLASSGRLIPWSEMEDHFARNWNQPEETRVLYLQSHHMVAWLVKRFTFERLMILLDTLRTGQNLDAAMVSAYGLPVEIMEVHWAREFE